MISRTYRNYVARILVILLLLLLYAASAGNVLFIFYFFFDRSKFWEENFIREIGKSCRRRALETDDMSGYHYI